MGGRRIKWTVPSGRGDRAVIMFFLLNYYHNWTQGSCRLSFDSKFPNQQKTNRASTFVLEGGWSSFNFLLTQRFVQDFTARRIIRWYVKLSVIGDGQCSLFNHKFPLDELKKNFFQKWKIDRMNLCSWSIAACIFILVSIGNSMLW